jgi:hypothetical protein
MKALLRMSRFVVISPFLLGRFGGPSTTLSAEITAPPKSPAPIEAPAVVSEPAYGSRIEPGLMKGADTGTAKTPCNRRGSTRDWYKAVAPENNITLDALLEPGGWGHEQKSVPGPVSSDHRAPRAAGPLASRTLHGVPIA